jgi:hypothetical protein
MKHTPQSALSMLNNDILKVFDRAPVVSATELAVAKFVQAGLDHLVERAELDVKLSFSVEFDPKEGRYMAVLKGAF